MGNLSFHESTVSGFTSPDSPTTDFCVMLKAFFPLVQPSIGCLEVRLTPCGCNFFGLLRQLKSSWIDVLRASQQIPLVECIVHISILGCLRSCRSSDLLASYNDIMLSFSIHDIWVLRTRGGCIIIQ